MTAVTDAIAFDVIVIGSGIGGLACAVALSRSGRKVLVLEQHFVAGGLTQTFSREGFTWEVRLHYLGDVHEGGGAAGARLAVGRSDSLLTVGVVYDTVHFPEGFEVLFLRCRGGSPCRAQLRRRWFPATGWRWRTFSLSSRLISRIQPYSDTGVMQLDSAEAEGRHISRGWRGREVRQAMYLRVPWAVGTEPFGHPD
jgi:hypothetical protein